MAASFCCKHDDLPFIYLGLPVGDNPRCGHFWNRVIEKIEGRLAGWKGKLLSIGGRLTVLKSVLDSIPVFYLSLFKMPKMIIDKIDGLRRNFLWGIQEGVRSIHWVAWKKVTSDKSMGGLSLRRVDDFNFSLLSKWAWRWKMEKSALWAQLISAIYGEQGGFDFCPQANNFRSVWRSIIDNCQGRICMGLNVLSCIKRVVANGVSTKFWTDSWHDDHQPLHQLFPRLFALELEKECSIAERRVLRNDGWAFQWNWRTPPRGRSDDELHRLEELLRSLVLDHSKTDEWKWGLEANGLFSVKGLYRHLCFLRTPNIPRRPQFIWNSWVPIKVNVTVWRACLNRLPVVDNLIKRGIRCGISLCPLGCGVPESVEHSFCSCLNVGTLWKKVFAWWNLAFPANFGWDFIRRSLFVRSFSCLAEKAFHGVCCVTLWHLWTRRNRCIFDNASATNVLLEDDLFSRIQSKALCWLKYRSKAVSGQWSDWISNPKNLFP